MPPTSTLRTPVTPTLTLSRTIAPHAVSVEIHDDAGKTLYAEEIAMTSAAAPSVPATEPTDPEQAHPVL